MHPSAWFVLTLAGASVAEVHDNGPSCRKQALQHRRFNATCDFETGAELTLEAAGHAGWYRAQLLAPENRCWAQGVAITLYNYYALNESQCRGDIDLRGHSEIHSYQKFECQKGDLLSSDAILSGSPVPKINITYNLELVYGGCYWMSFTVFKNSRESKTKEKAFWINNNCTKEEMYHNLNITIYTSDTISLSDPVMTFIFHRKVQKQFRMILEGNEVPMDITKSCTLKYKGDTSEVSCRMPNGTAPGNYSMEFFSNAAFCGGHTFQKYCRTLKEFTIVPATTPASPPSPGSGQGLVTIAAVAVASFTLLMMVLLGYYHIAKRRLLTDQAKMLLNRSKFRPLEVAVRERAGEVKGIVLVYARDCEPFMELMLLLRRTLEEQCGVKVYDIFDTELFNREVAASPHDWAVNMMREPGVRVVVVKTPCGELLYETMMIEGSCGLQLCESALPSRVQYLVPRFADSLLLLLFRLIKDDAVGHGSYLKYFVVQISNFYGEKQLPEVNPFTRYELPGAAPLLLAALGAAGGPARARCDELRGAVRALHEHVSARPDYMLSDLLHVVG